jgi:hypothetical protein
MREDRVEDIPQLSPDGNGILTTVFTEEQVFEAISQMKHNNSHGSDGFPAEFYKQFWGSIKHDLMNLFAELYQGDLQLYKINFR